MPPPAPNMALKEPGQERRSGRVVLSNSSGDKDDFICKIPYLNRLPDIPAEPKYLVYNVDMSPYIKYTATSLEKEYRRDINCDSDMGMKLNLLTIQNLRPDETAAHSDIDALLCSDEVFSDATPAKPARMDHGRHVAWLRKSQLILNDYAQHRSEGTADKQRTKPVPVMDINLRTRAKRVEAILETFDYSVNKPKRHPNKPNLSVVEESPVLPNMDLAKYSKVVVTFENDPAPPHTPNFSPDEVMANAMLKGMTDVTGKAIYVAYFMPLEETMQKLMATRGNVDDEEEYSYKLHREFNLPVDDRPRAGNKTEDQSFALNIRDNVASYAEMETRVRLVRRPRPPGAKKSNARLVVRFRGVNPDEEDQQRRNLGAFELGGPEQEEEHQLQETHAVEHDAASNSSSEAPPSEDGPSDQEDNNERSNNVKKRDAEEDTVSSPSHAGSSSKSESGSESETEKKPKITPVSKTELFGSDSENSD